MSFLSSLGGVAGSIMGLSDGQVQDTHQALTDALNSGALQAAASYGKQGAALQDQAAALGHRNVSIDNSAANADEARLAAVRAHYADLYRNGGLAGQAAVQAAQQAAVMGAHGGVAGIHQDTLQSGDMLNRVGDIAQSEMTQAGDAENKLDTQKAAVALKQAAMAAEVTHANLLKNINTHQVQFGLQNSQQSLYNTMQSELNDTNNSATAANIDQQSQQAKIGQASLQALANALAGGVGIATDMAKDDDDDDDDDDDKKIRIKIVHDYTQGGSGGGAGYAAPIAPAVTSSSPGAISPIFANSQALPSEASYFNRGR